MIPILYAPGTTTFNNNGIGFLSDAISCQVTQEVNGEYELELIYPVDGVHRDKLIYESIIRAMVHPDFGTDFMDEFDVYSISKDLSGQISVKARQLGYRLKNVPVRILPRTYLGVMSEAINTIKSRCLTEHDFTITGVGNGALRNFENYYEELVESSEDEPTYIVYNNAQNVVTNLRDMLNGNDISLTSLFYAEIGYSHKNVRAYYNGITTTNKTANIVYGHNLIDFAQEESIGDTYTHIYPYWINDSGTYEDLTSYGLPAIKRVATNYSIPRVLITTIDGYYPYSGDFSDYVDEFIANNPNLFKPAVSLTVNFAQLRQTEEYKEIVELESVGLGDNVNVYFDKLGVDSSARVTAYNFDSLRERYDSVTVGQAQSNLATTIANSVRGNIKMNGRYKI